MFTLMLMDPTTKKRSKRNEIFRNIVDAIDAYLRQNGTLKEEPIGNSDEDEERRTGESSSFMFLNGREEKDEETVLKPIQRVDVHHTATKSCASK